MLLLDTVAAGFVVAGAVLVAAVAGVGVVVVVVKLALHCLV